MTMPNFLIIGAAKSGTTSLYNYLKQHPQIYVSPRKELNFFDSEAETTDSPIYGDQQHISNNIANLETYQSYFQDVLNETAIGEASPRYIYIPKTAERIKHYIPDVKLIAILRNPVDRAYSSYMHLVTRASESLSFTQALLAEDKRIKNNWEPLWHYKQMGFYYAQLKRYFEIFDSKQIRIYLYEDLKNSSSCVVKDILRFLEVDDTMIPQNIAKIYNEAGVPKNNKLHKFIHGESLTKSALKLFLPSKLRKFANQQNLAKKPELDQNIRRQLIQEYRVDITKLQNLIQRDLSPWLQID